VDRDEAIISEGASARHPRINLARLRPVPIASWQEEVVALSALEHADLPAEFVTIDAQPKPLSDVPHEATVRGGETERQGWLFWGTGSKRTGPEAEQSKNSYERAHGETERSR
jgi:hypothetical protein